MACVQTSEKRFSCDIKLFESLYRLAIILTILQACQDQSALSCRQLVSLRNTTATRRFLPIRQHSSARQEMSGSRMRNARPCSQNKYKPPTLKPLRTSHSQLFRIEAARQTSMPRLVQRMPLASPEEEATDSRVLSGFRVLVCCR